MATRASVAKVAAHLLVVDNPTKRAKRQRHWLRAVVERRRRRAARQAGALAHRACFASRILSLNNSLYANTQWRASVAKRHAQTRWRFGCVERGLFHDARLG
jgi:hypothetical protein